MRMNETDNEAWALEQIHVHVAFVTGRLIEGYMIVYNVF